MPHSLYAPYSTHPTRVPAADALTDALARIRDEGLNRSQVMPLLAHLTDTIGPRLTGSANLKRANEWTRDTLAGWGLRNARLEPWGPGTPWNGRGWRVERFALWGEAPLRIPLDACPRAWSPGVRGTKTGPVVFVDARDEAGLAKFRGRLRGAFVITSPPIPIPPIQEAEATRISDEQLRQWEDAPAPPPPTPRPTAAPDPQRRARIDFLARQAEFFLREGVVATLYPSYPPLPGALFVEAAYLALPSDIPPGKYLQPFDPAAPPFLPQIVVATEQYNRIVRLCQAGERVTLSLTLSVRYEKDRLAYNTVAEIPGTDKAEEIVMCGAHLDSWHAGTGATDDGIGVAACLEAMRILQKLGLRSRRTLRIGLWSGEEQGALGSAAYVRQHLGTYNPNGPVQNKTLEYDCFSVYFHLDIGAGRVRGVFLNGNTAARPQLREWLRSLSDLGATTTTLAGAPGSDHDNFDAIGLPAFMLIQDDLDYFTRTHHSSQDIYDRVPPDDARQIATVVTALLYQAAMAETPVPRKG